MADGNLGGASFIVSANTQVFERALRQAESTSRDASDRIAQNLRKIEEAGRRAEEALSMRGSGGFRNPAMGFLAISQAIEDSAYGFNAIVNNIPMIVMGLGGGPGLAGVASLAAVALNELNKHVGDLRDILAGAWLGVPVEQLTQMRQKAEEAAEGFERLVKLRPEAEEKGEKILNAGIAEAGVEGVTKATREAIMRDNGLRPRLGPGDAADVLKRAMGKAMVPGENRGFKELQEEAKGDILKERAEATTKEVLGLLSKHGPAGDQARQTMDRLLKENPGAFPDKFREAFEASKPEAQKRQKDFDKQAEVRKKVEEQIKKADREHAAALEKQIAAEKQIARQKKEVENERRRDRVEELRDRAELLQEKIKKGMHGLNAAQQKQVQDAVLGVKAPEQSRVLSTKSYIDRTMTGALSKGDQKQVDELVKQTKLLDEIKRELKDVGRLK